SEEKNGPLNSNLFLEPNCFLQPIIFISTPDRTSKIFKYLSTVTPHHHRCCYCVIRWLFQKKEQNMLKKIVPKFFSKNYFYKLILNIIQPHKIFFL
ncbi:hypothetical protein VIGAN_10216300, partial [Vigna angularis var. angularis]